MSFAGYIHCLMRYVSRTAKEGFRTEPSSQVSKCGSNTLVSEQDVENEFSEGLRVSSGEKSMTISNDFGLKISPLSNGPHLAPSNDSPLQSRQSMFLKFLFIFSEKTSPEFPFMHSSLCSLSTGHVETIGKQVRTTKKSSGSMDLYRQYFR